jgi:RNA polymerase sigma-70 factor (ECF subfamily)
VSPLPVDDDLDGFSAHRPRLMAIAYRMLGSVVEAEDVVGDVALRWSTVDRTDIRSAEAWLVTVTTRRSLDVLRSARLQRESYPGVWLPEPIATTADPADEVERLETLTLGFLLLLERLTPIERAVLVLHDALDYPYPTIAEAVGRSEDACRQTLHRARRHVTVPGRRAEAELARAEGIAEQFMMATFSGDTDGLLALLAPSIAVVSDGGGIVHAAMRPVTDRERVARFLTNLTARMGADPLALPCRLNGEPGLLLHGDGWAAVAVEVVDDLVTNVRVMVNPAKLERLVESFGVAAAGRPGPFETPTRFRHRGGHTVR